MKNSMKEIKNKLVSVRNSVDQMKEIINDIKDRSLEMMQREEKRDSSIKN